jgi:hypothetical protein
VPRPFVPIEGGTRKTINVTFPDGYMVMPFPLGTLHLVSTLVCTGGVFVAAPYSLTP